MILPSILITFVGFLGFLIPPDSGEKVSLGKHFRNYFICQLNNLNFFYLFIFRLGVTTLLSMTVFLMVVFEQMPPNSDSVPLIGKNNIF